MACHIAHTSAISACFIKPAHCGVGHISDHSRGRRDMSLALSVWWCRPTGSAARAEHGGGAPVFISVFAGAFSWRARFSGVAPLTRHVTRAHSPRFPRGLAWLPSCSLTCVHMLMGRWQAFATRVKSDHSINSTSSIGRCSIKRVARGPSGRARARAQSRKEPYAATAHRAIPATEFIWEWP